MDVDRGASNIGMKLNSSNDQMRIDEFSGHHVERIKHVSGEGTANQSGDVESETKFSDKRQTKRSNKDTKNFIGGTSSWDPYSTVVDSDFLKASLASQGMPMRIEKQDDSMGEETTCEVMPEDAPEDNNLMTSALREAETAERANGEKTLKDVVKAKNRKPGRKSRSSSGPS